MNSAGHSYALFRKCFTMHKTRLFRFVAIVFFGVLISGLIAMAVVRQWRTIYRSPLATPSKAAITENCEWPYTVSVTAEMLQPSGPTPSETSVPTNTETPLIQCTPPPCDLAAGEVYFCPDVCPGGCGTICATATPEAICSPPPCGPYDAIICPYGDCPNHCGLICITPQAVCTPPLCAIGTNEAYFCPEVCPGGCGTICATYTPTPEN